MFKLVVLLSVAAMAAAKPGFVAPVAYGAVPAVSSVSRYDTSIVHGSPAVYAAPAVYTAPAVYSAPAVYGGYHHLGKRSVVAPLAYGPLVSPAAYSAPVVSAYAAPIVASPYGYPAVYPRAYSVHPY